MTQQESALDLSVIDSETLKKIKGKQARADRVMQAIREYGVDQDKAFMDEILPWMEELLKEDE